ncbi:MAG: hypothetical protein ACO3JL_11715 [Myxococcota bacterium]
MSTPVYDDELGVQAIPAAEGSLAGTFALKTINATQVNVPLALDEEPLGGGVNFRLVTRAWDVETARYLQRSVLCGGYNFEVLGVVTTVPTSTYQLVAPSDDGLRVDHERGTYEAGGHVQLWAIDLDDPLTAAFPSDREEASAAPFAERIFDMEDDGNPGLTLYVSGLVEGEVYAVQRKRVDLRGVLLGADHAVGLAQNRFESVTLGNNNSVLDAADQGSAEPHPDPKESWFEEVRVSEATTCDDVLRLEEQGVLGRNRPF